MAGEADYPSGWSQYLRDVRRETIKVQQPAAGSDWSVQVPGDQEWSIRGLFAQFQTSAVVANRGARLLVNDGNVNVLAVQPSQAMAAGLVFTVGLVLGGPTASNAVTQAVQWGGPDPFSLPPGFVLKTSTVNIDVADQWSQIALDVLVTVQRGEAAARRYQQWVEDRRRHLEALPPLGV